MLDHGEGLGVQQTGCTLHSTSTAVVQVDSQAFHVVSTPDLARPGKAEKDTKSPWFSVDAPGIYAVQQDGGQTPFQVGKVRACNEWVHVPFHKSFGAPPVVIASMQSLSSNFHKMQAKSVEARVRAVTKDGFMLALDTVGTLPCGETE